MLSQSDFTLMTADDTTALPSRLEETAPADALAVSVKMLSALAHEGRLTLLRLLIQKGPEGLAAGELARRATIGATTASAQLLVLSNTGLVHSRRAGRQVIYAANFAAMEGLLGFLLQDCCCGRAEICEPLAARMAR